MKVLPITDEKELLLRLRDGDDRAFQQIYNRYAKQLAYRLYQLVKIDGVVEEIHQDVFLRLWNARANVDKDTNLKAYLFAIARNLTIDFYHKATKDKELENQLMIDATVVYDHIEPLLNAKETAGILQGLINMLPPQRQKVFRMIKIEGKSYRETSEYFGVSISTVKDHMAKSVDFLRKELAQKYPHITISIALCELILN